MEEEFREEIALERTPQILTIVGELEKAMETKNKWRKRIWTKTKKTLRFY